MIYLDIFVEFDGDKGLLVVRDGEHKVGRARSGIAGRALIGQILGVSRTDSVQRSKV